MTTTTTKELIPEGTYDVTVSDARLRWTKNGYEMLILELTILGGEHKGKKFETFNMLNCRDNNYYVRQTLSALLRREVAVRDSVEVADLFGRCARVKVEHEEWNGMTRERVTEWKQSRRKNKVKEYERERIPEAELNKRGIYPIPRDCDFIELFDMGYPIFGRRR